MTSADAAMHALLAGLVTGLFMLQPLAHLGWVPGWLPTLVTLGTIVAGALALTRPTWLHWPLATSGAVVALSIGLGSFALGAAGAVAGLLMISLALLRQVLAPGIVTGRRIEGAIALYLLMALMFASAYELTERVIPGAFAGATEVPQAFRYFSLVVQTSTGFGDIVPVSPMARTLAVMQAVLGQLFIAVLLARLVSLELAGRRDG